MSTYYELQPAYGRDYKTAKEAIQAFLDGKDWEGDFQMGFKPCGIADFKPGDVVNLRYGKLRKVAVYQIKDNRPTKVIQSEEQSILKHALAGEGGLILGAVIRDMQK